MNRADLVLVTERWSAPRVGGRPRTGFGSCAGWRVHVPDVSAISGTLPHWRELAAQYAKLLSLDEAAVLIGHSLATVVIVDLAARVPARGLIMVDGEVPPASGAVAPGRDFFGVFVAYIADRDGRLPRWSEWPYPRPDLIGIDALAQNTDALAAFEKDQPHVSLAWFDDAIDLLPWADIPAGFIQTSALFDHAADEAARRGWPVERIKGTHLHPTLQPDETAAAIETVCAKLLVNNRG